MVSGPGEGTEPRVPQSLAFTGRLAPDFVRGGGPEDGDRAARAVRRLDREGRSLDLVAGAVGRADLELGVGGAVVAHCGDQRQLVVGDRLAALVEGAEEGAPLLWADRAQFFPGLAEQDPGGLVVKDEDAALVDQEGRCRQSRHQVAGKNQLKWLLGGGWHVIN